MNFGNPPSLVNGLKYWTHPDTIRFALTGKRNLNGCAQEDAAKHFIELSLEAVAAESRGSSFCLRNRFRLFEKPLQIDAVDRSGGIKAALHLDFLAHLVCQPGRNIIRFRLAIDQHGDLVL